MRGSFCLPTGGVRPPNLALFQNDPYMQYERSIMSSLCLQYGRVMRTNEKHHAVTAFAIREGCEALWIILCADAGSEPPQPPRCFRATHASTKKEASCHHYVCSERICADHFVCKGAALPPTPRLFKTTHVCNKKASCHHNVCNRARWCRAFCLRLIFPNCVSNQVLSLCRGNATLE